MQNLPTASRRVKNPNSLYRRHQAVGELIQRTLQRDSAIVIPFNRIRPVPVLTAARSDAAVVQPQRGAVPVNATCRAPTLHTRE
jgi:hypothetical protein